MSIVSCEPDVRHLLLLQSHPESNPNANPDSVVAGPSDGVHFLAAAAAKAAKLETDSTSGDSDDEDVVVAQERSKK